MKNTKKKTEGAENVGELGAVGGKGGDHLGLRKCIGERIADKV